MNDFKEFFIERSICVDCEKRFVREEILSVFDSFIRGKCWCYEKMCFCGYCKYGGSSLYCNKIVFAPIVFAMTVEDWSDESYSDFLLLYLVNDEFLVNSNDLFLSQSLLGTLSKVGVLRHSDFEEEEEWVFIYFNTFPFLLYCLLCDKL